MRNRKMWTIIVSGLFLSSIIAGISGAFLIIEGELTTLLWEVLPAQMKWPILYYFVLCVLGALVLSYLKKRFGQIPQTAHEALTELKAKQSVDYSGVFRNLLAALVILIFGAGVGPEAALLGAIISLSGNLISYGTFIFIMTSKNSKHFGQKSSACCIRNSLFSATIRCSLL